MLLQLGLMHAVAARLLLVLLRPLLLMSLHVAHDAHATFDCLRPSAGAQQRNKQRVSNHFGTGNQCARQHGGFQNFGAGGQRLKNRSGCIPIPIATHQPTTSQFSQQTNTSRRSSGVFVRKRDQKGTCGHNTETETETNGNKRKQRKLKPKRPRKQTETSGN